MKKIYQVIKWVLLAVMVGGGVYFYNQLPEIIPTHWNWAGEADGFGQKNYILVLMPVIVLALMGLFAVLPTIDPKKDKYEKFADIYEIIQVAIIGFFTYMYYVSIYAALREGVDVGMYVILGVGVLFVLLGNYMGKLRQNYFVGIKTPWTLADEEVWNKTHRFGGWCFVVAGLIFIVQAFMTEKIFWLFVVSILVAALLPIVYSYWLARRR